MKDNEITSFDKELNKFLQPKCLIPGGLGRCYEIINIYRLIGQKVCVKTLMTLVNI